MDRDMIAACGLDCEACEIRRVPFDPQAAESVVAWFKSQGWLAESEGVSQVLERSMYCTGCQGDRSLHWSADCWILQCCVDERKLRHCSECELFACDRLVDWASQNEGYTAALARLRQML
jgi:hypothetical protein